MEPIGLVASGARLIEEDEKTFAAIDCRLSKLKDARWRPRSCERIMAELTARQQERKKKAWWEKLFRLG